MTLTIDTEFTLDLLQNMVRIDSINPDLSPSGGGEGEIAAYIEKVLQSLGLAVTKEELAPGRFNVVGTLKGTGGGRSLMLNGHMDTVGVEGMDEPFSADVREGRLYGRGSQDMKGSMAAMISAAKAIIDSGEPLAGDLILTAVADEEYASIGTERIVETLKADAAIVTEPTDMAVCRAHRGFIWFKVITEGRAAHGSRYKEGVDAIMRMGRFLAELDKLEKELRTRTPHPLVGPPSLHTSLISGGSEPSVYAARCEVFIERRTIPGETAEQATAEIQTILNKLAGEDSTFKAELIREFQREPFEVAEDAEIVQIVDRAVADRLGDSPPHMGQTFWTDAALLSEADIESMLFGPLGAGMHSNVEWVDMQSVIDTAHILAETARAYCV